MTLLIKWRFTSAVALLALVACGGGGGGAAPAVEITDAAISISALQGSGTNSPFEGRVVTITGVVSGDFQEDDEDTGSNLGGFFMQSESPDMDAVTSEGIFVFDGDHPQVAVRPGDRVTVSGEVQEFFGETQLVAATVSVMGRGAVSAVDVVFPAANSVTNSDGELVADLEAYEGMLVRIPQTLTVTEIRNIERFGELKLSEGGRLMQFTNTNLPDVDAYALHRDMNARRSIVLDDGRRAQNVNPLRYLENSAGTALRIGDTTSGLVGVLRYARGSGGNGAQAWRLVPTAEPVFDDSNPRPGPPTVAGRLRIVSVNALNMFAGIDMGANDCGPAAADNCRGADSPEERVRQLAKFATAVRMMDADIVGLVELENRGNVSLDLLVDALNEQIGSQSYAYIATGVIGDDAIRSGFVYKTTTIVPVGAFAVLDSTVDSRFNDDKNRPVLAQTFRERNADASLSVAVAHLKSKGSDCEAESDPNTNDGQGNCNQVRTDAALAMADWLLSDPTGSGDADVLLIGDLNAYSQEDPLAALRSLGFVDLLDAANTAPYSFVFDGQSGALDHALVSPSLPPQVAGVIEWHTNADEAPIHDYNLEHGRDPDLFDPDSPYRFSDHDPMIVGLDLN